MIGSLRGVVVDRSEGDVVVEVAGIGYRVRTTPGTSATVTVGGEAFLWIHHHIREALQELYGFTSRDERNVFETLIGTHGVGPALGLAILSVHSPSSLRVALSSDDVGALCLVAGVGKKTAARLLVELKSRLDAGDVSLPEPSDAPVDVRDALSGLGYGPDEIAGALRDLPGALDTSEMLRAALQRLAAA